MNQSVLLERTVLSVLSQQYPNIEYIIIDGGSTDASVDIIRRYSNRLSHWISEPDDGQADAIHKGFLLSTGDIIAWLNSDDMLIPGALEKVNQFFNDNPDEEVVTGGHINIDIDDRICHSPLGFPSSDLTRGSLTFHKLLFGECFIAQPATFFKRSAYNAVGGLDRSLHFSMDYDLWLKLSQRRPIARIFEYLALYRSHPESKTSTINHVRNQNDEFLYSKYGKYNKSKLNRIFWYHKYMIQDRLREYFYKFRILIRSHRLPENILPSQIK